MKVKKISLKKRKRIHTLVRLAVQILFFIFFPSVYSSAFNGAKYICTNIGQKNMIELTPFITILIIICIYTVIFGRFFCGYACAFGSLGDWIYAINAGIAKKRKKKPFGIPEKLMKVLSFAKYFILAGILFLCIRGIYAKTAGMSPWDVFSLIHSRKLMFSGYTVGCIILALIIIGMFFNERFFCRVLCPMGAVFSVLPVIPYFSLFRDRQSCLKGCSLCTGTCPSDIDLPDMQSVNTASDCFQCDKCASACPKSNISYGKTGLKSPSVLFTIIRAGILAAVFVWLGI